MDLLKLLDQVTGPDAPSKAAHIVADLTQHSTFLRFLTPQASTGLRAYRHDNGYFKIELAKATHSDARLRLNVWKSGLANMENIHDHKWNYVSAVLVGAIREELFCPSENDGAVYYRHRYQSRMAKEDYAIHVEAEQRLRRYGAVTWSQGAIYERSASLIHRILRTEPLVATLQITYWNRPANSSHVYCVAPLGQGSQQVPSPSLSPEEVAEVTASVARVLSDAN